MLEINTSHNGDCLELMKDIEDKSIDMILCDLPYGSTKCKWDIIIPMDELWEQYNRITKDNAAIVLFASQPFTSLLGASNIKNLRYSWAWIKSRPTGHLNAKKQPLTGFEDILVFYKKLPTYNPQGLIKIDKMIKNSASDLRRNKDNVTSTVSGGLKDQEYKQEFTNYPKGTLEFASVGTPQHPTEKPVSLLEYLIKTYTNEGDLVLDNCAGSGSTLISAKNTKRNYLGIEKDKEYHKLIIERLK